MLECVLGAKHTQAGAGRRGRGHVAYSAACALCAAKYVSELEHLSSGVHLDERFVDVTFAPRKKCCRRRPPMSCRDCRASQDRVVSHFRCSLNFPFTRDSEIALPSASTAKELAATHPPPIYRAKEIRLRMQSDACRSIIAPGKPLAKNRTVDDKDPLQRVS